MIAEENFSNIERPDISVSNTKTILLIIDLIKQTVPYFKSYIISEFYHKRKLSEDDFSQIFVEQAQILIRLKDFPFNIGCQYQDIYNLGKGYPDIYFYPNEQNISTESLFVVESKRLPSPDQSREKEYVIGNKENGGIERFKLEKHGKGLELCGLLAYIEKESYDHWKTKINDWIMDLAKIEANWFDYEVLIQEDMAENYCLLKSIAQRKENNISLIHLWIRLNYVSSNK